jgi:hypothetical protein
METRHIKLGYEEAIFAKRQILSSEINSLNILKEIRAHQILRKKNAALKSKLKNSFSELRLKINLLTSTFPEEEKTPIKIESREIKKDKKHKEDIQSQLEEIKNKLARLQ